MMIVGVPRESFPGELRVALTPAVVPSLAKAGLEVVVEAGAGIRAGYPDADYVSKGAKILSLRAEVFRVADIIAQVLCYGSNDISGKDDLPLFHRDQLLVGFLRPLGNLETIQEIAGAGVASFSLELMPRTTLPHVCHGGRDDHSWTRIYHRRRGCRTSGYRHRAQTRSRYVCLRHEARREGTGSQPGSKICRASHRSNRCTGCRRLRASTG